MRRWLRRIVVVVLVLLLLAAAMWCVSRLRGPTAEQRQALELFQSMPPPEGSNAFAALWLLPWDVPPAQQEAVVEEDARRFGALPAPGDPARAAAAGAFRSVAADRYRDLEADLAAEPVSCDLQAGGCLAAVREERDAHAARLEAAAPLVDRVEAVFDHDHYRSRLPVAFDMPFPRLPLMSLAGTRHALQFVDGDVDGALAGTCRSLAGWRRLAGNSDTLLVAMYAAAGAGSQAGLLAEMLAELPVEHPVPAACTEALAPLQDGEMGLCRALRGEWEFGRTALDMIESGETRWARLQRSLILDRKATEALSAWNLSGACGEEAAAALAEDRPMSLRRDDGRAWRFECVANSAGCVLMDIARPAYVDYGLRMQDARARIRLLAAVEWMRGQAAAGDPRAAGELLKEFPGGLRSQARAVDIDPESGRLRMALFHARQDTHWSIPLPPALSAPGEGDAPAAR